MWRATLRTAFAHKGRLLLSGVAIVLGVAFVTGSLILTNALDRTFTSIIEGAAQDIQIAPESAISASRRSPVNRLTLADDLVADVSEVPGVAEAGGSVNQNGAFLLDSKGDLIGAEGPPALAMNWQDNVLLNPAVLAQGRAPEEDGEVAVDELTFANLGIEIGAPLVVITPKGPLETTLVGTFSFGATGGLAGATLTAFTAKQAQEIYTEPGRWNTIDIAVADGYSEAQVADAIQSLGIEDITVTTRGEQVEDQSAALQEGLAFVTYVIGGFAAISLFVAAFLIYNTFAMLVTQRSRELAVFRALGATRAQVLRSILAEAAVVGTIAAVAGIGAGLVLAIGLGALFGTFGLNLTSGLSLTTGSVVTAAIVGIGVTVVAAFLPAYRGGRTSPLAAIRDTFSDRGRLGRLRIASGVLAFLLSGLLISRGLGIADEAERVQQTAFGLLVLIGAVILLAPLLAVALVRLSTPVLRILAPAIGDLAARNAARAPNRLATTASALTIGVALVISATVITASARASLEQLVDDTFGAEYVIGSITGRGFDGQVAEVVRDVPGVEYAVSVAGGRVLLGDEEERAVAVGGGPLDAVYAVAPVTGAFARISSGEFVVDNETAVERGWQVGDTAQIKYSDGSEAEYTLIGTYEGSELLQGVILDLSDFRANGGAPTDQAVFVTTVPGFDESEVAADLAASIENDPLLQVLDQTAIKDQNAQQLNQVLYIIYALLALSVVIASLGVLNTLVLAVIERTREIGLMRAVGATQRQIRRMIRLEAVVIATLGAVLGIAVGLISGVILQRALTETGVQQLVIPVETTIVTLAIALLIGVLAAAIPARRAARLDLLQAISTE